MKEETMKRKYSELQIQKWYTNIKTCPYAFRDLKLFKSWLESVKKIKIPMNDLKIIIQKIKTYQGHVISPFRREERKVRIDGSFITGMFLSRI